MADAKGPTPAMKQWQHFKDLHPEKILLFRMGDFYEMFGEDARVAAEVLEIALTTRDRGKENPLPMCGIPHHALDGYLARLIRSGHKAVLCEQLEDPSQAKGVVKRGITRIITPGTVLEEGVMGGAETVLLAAWNPGDARSGVAWADLSSGEVRLFVGPCEEALDRLRALEPREVLFPDAEGGAPPGIGQRTLTPLPARRFTDGRIREALPRFFDLPARLPGLPADPEPLGALHALASYVEDQGSATLTAPVWERSESILAMDEATRRNLELVANLEDGSTTGTLLHTLDACRSPMGTPLLRDWILAPPARRETILDRQAEVTAWHDAPTALRSLRETLRGIPDLARVTARLAASIASPRDVGAVRNALLRLPMVRAACEDAGREAWEAGSAIPLMEAWRDRLSESLPENPPPHTRDGNLFAPGVDGELDRLRSLSENAREALLALEASERERTGIGSLKVRYNKVFGYFIEVSKANLSKVPEDYERRQTLVGSERYVTAELKRLEAEILSAREERERLELRLWEELLSELREEVPALREIASRLAEMDVLAAFAHRALDRGYVPPSLHDEPTLDIEEGRHPVLEADPRHQPFVPNGFRCDADTDQILLITGPNMGGKSTYLRQNALIVLMAHLGSYVPAARASIGLCDRLFCRVGAGDSLLRGLSTFMVEMTETAAILRNATRRSMVLLDEVGRGTSTYDGLAIAWAVVEALARPGGLGSRTLFATHYHELTQLASMMEGVKNLTMGVREHLGKVIFLRTVEEGAADRSYGIHVAELAGVPEAAVRRAREILADLEARRDRLADRTPTPDAPVQPTLFGADPREAEAARLIRETDPDRTTPVDALALLDRLRRLLSND